MRQDSYHSEQTTLSFDMQLQVLYEIFEALSFENKN